MTRIGAILRYKSSPGVRTEAWSRGPFGDATAKVCIRTRYARCAYIPLPGRIPASGRIGGRKRGPELVRGSDPEEARRASIDALTASFTVASPKGPLLRV